MTSSRLVLLDDPQLRPFLPLLYVAWADGDLSSKERAAVAARLEAQPWLRPAAREAITAWLEAQPPPSAVELEELRTTLRRAAGTMSGAARRSLVSLGRAMAHDDGLARESAEAVADIAELLGARDVELAAEGLDAPAPRLDTAPSPIDARAIQAVLDRDHPDVRARVRSFLADPEHRAYALDKDRYRALVRGWLKELADLGIGKLAYPGVTSGAPSSSGLASPVPDLRAFMVAFETAALGDLSTLVKMGVQWGLFGGSIYFLGSDRHRALLADVASLALPGCFAMSEIGHGSNVSDLETVARYDASTRELVIHTPSESARKDWIGGAARDARMATVFAQLEVGDQRHGVHAVLVPIRDQQGELLPGVRAGDCGSKMGLNGVDNGRLWFDQVRVPVANLLDRFAHIDEHGRYQSSISSPGRRFFMMLGTLVGGRVSVGSAGVSVAKSALAIAVRYALARRQFGPAEGREVNLLTYPTHQRRLLPALAQTYVLHFAFERLRAEFVRAHAADDTRALEAQAAGLKAIATWHATRTVQQCREACGAQGYLSVNRLPDLKADSDVFTTFEGDNTVLLQLVARSLLTGFGKQLEDGGISTVLRMVGKIAWTAASEKNPITTRDTSREHLRDPQFHLAALGHREDVLVRTAALRMRRRLGAKMDPHAALLEVQEHLVAAAIAHVDRLALGWFRDAVADVSEPEVRSWLDRVGQLHALARMEETMAWYLEDGYVEASKARAIRKEVEALCRELVPAARALVDGFGIPDACLGAPIAFFDPAHPDYLRAISQSP